MSERMRGAVERMRRILGLRGEEPPRFPGETVVRVGRRALVGLESLGAEELVGIEPPGGGESRNAFGERTRRSHAPTARAVLATASGLARGGRRVAAFLPAGGLESVADGLADAVARRLPLVVHASLGEGHAALHAVADGGALVLVARDLQQALDLSLIARRVAEASLTPAIVATDADSIAWAVHDTRLPEADLVRAFLGSPDDTIECPTASQELLFGAERRRLPRWFDLDRPVSHGGGWRAEEVDSATWARRTFFADHVEELAYDALAESATLTGRVTGWVTRHRLEDATYAVVAQGSAVEVAEDAADWLRESEGMRVGVLGLPWLRPFPAEEVREALPHARAVTVLDRIEQESSAATPLLREVHLALGDRSPHLVSATFSRLGTGQVLAACRNMLDSRRVASSVRLAPGPLETGSDQPRRDALLQHLRRDYPVLERRLLPPEEAPDTRPRGSRSLALHVSRRGLPVRELESLAEMLTEAGGHVRSRVYEVEPGCWQARITAAPTRIVAPDDAMRADLVVVANVESTSATNPFREAAARASVLFVSCLEPRALWELLSAERRAIVRERQLRLYVAGGELDDWLGTVRDLLGGDAEGAREIDWRREGAATEEIEERLPLAVRRFSNVGQGYDNVARFWTEQVEPRRARAGCSPTPDPYLALGAMPAATATLRDRAHTREELPRVDPEACTACGRCWVSCPDSALEPVVCGFESLLGWAAERAAASNADAEGPAAAALKRAHRRLAARIHSLLARDGGRSPSTELLCEAFDWLAGKLDRGEREREEMERAFLATVEELEALPLCGSDALFHDAERQAKGSGGLMLLAVNPQACQGCGVCREVCPEGAIETGPRGPDAVARARFLRDAWETLPDTPGSMIRHAAAHPAVGRLAAVLLSRHCLFSMAGGDAAERGSGERIAVRQVLAVTEYEMQGRTLSTVRDLDGLVGRLEGALRERLHDAVPTDDLDALARSLGPGPRDDLSRVLTRLRESGTTAAAVDADAVRRLARAAREVRELHLNLEQGSGGLGRARFGLVVAGHTAASWAASFPYNPFSVPVAAEPRGEDAADVAAGLVAALAARRAEECRVLRRAELALEAPPDVAQRERALHDLGWEELTDDERSGCAPILLAASEDAFGGAGLAGLSRLLAGVLPIKVLWLDSRRLPLEAPDPALLGLAHRTAFVLSSSIAHPSHLFDGVEAALRFDGPALIHLHTPSPRRDGFPTGGTIRRAAAAVTSRVHPLLRYDPGAPGLFGRRLSLEGNPEPEASPDVSAAPTDPGSLSPDERGVRVGVPGPNVVAPLVGELLSRATAERAAHWATLQELAGIRTPFTAGVREGVEHELAERHAAELERQEARHREARTDSERVFREAQAQRIRDRLLEIAGFRRAPEAPDGSRS